MYAENLRFSLPQGGGANSYCLAAAAAGADTFFSEPTEPTERSIASRRVLGEGVQEGSEAWLETIWACTKPGNKFTRFRMLSQCNVGID